MKEILKRVQLDEKGNKEELENLLGKEAKTLKASTFQAPGLVSGAPPKTINIDKCIDKMIKHNHL